jgi:hypothetical protein
MCENIDYTNLPQTFADAVVCANNLGVKYLWIDSICIVQDDILDWQRQSAKMESYYSGAFVVIAAASADSGNAGFLKERPSVYTGIPFEFVPDSGIHDLVVQRIIPRRADSQRTATVAMEHDYIESRAWCMQETILARRVLFFHHSEILWQCQSMTRDGEDQSSSARLQSYDASPSIREFLGPCSGLLRYSASRYPRSTASTQYMWNGDTVSFRCTPPKP